MTHLEYVWVHFTVKLVYSSHIKFSWGEEVVEHLKKKAVSLVKNRNVQEPLMNADHREKYHNHGDTIAREKKGRCPK